MSLQTFAKDTLMLSGLVSLLLLQLPVPRSPLLADVSAQKGSRCEVF